MFKSWFPCMMRLSKAGNPLRFDAVGIHLIYHQTEIDTLEMLDDWKEEILSKPSENEVAQLMRNKSNILAINAGNV